MAKKTTVSLYEHEAEILPDGRALVDEKIVDVDHVFGVDEEGRLLWNPANKGQPADPGDKVDWLWGDS